MKNKHLKFVSGLTKTTMVLGCLLVSSSMTSPANATDYETHPTDCIRDVSTERSDYCLGTGLQGDSARDVRITLTNGCDRAIFVRQCFSFANGTTDTSYEYFQPGQRRGLTECTIRVGESTVPRYEPVPTQTYVYWAEDASYSDPCP